MYKQKSTVLIVLLSILFSFSAIAHETHTYEIEMTDTGFIPEEISIHQGDSLVFKNTGKNKHWPASDIHPTHTVYPGSNINNCGKKDHMFDSCKGLEPGETFEFIFEYPGSWTCHDHLNASLTCKIIVKERKGYIIPQPDEEQKLSRIKKLRINIASSIYNTFPNTFTAYIANPFSITKDEPELKYWLSENNPIIAMNWLLDAAFGGSWKDCHQEAHQIGRVSYELYGAKVFEEGDASCHSGFYHGAMERLLTEKGTENISEKIHEVCSFFTTDFSKYECIHGVGHGVLAFENYDLFKSLKICSRFNETFDQGACYSGVFMENVITAQGYGAIPGHETTWVSDDPHFPCILFNSSKEILERCYQMQTSWMLELSDYNFEKVATQCLSAPEKAIATCFLSFGRDASGASLRNPEKTKKLCKLVPELYQPECVQGAVSVIIDFWGTSLEDQAPDFCKVLDEKQKDSCYQIIQLRLAEVFETKEKALEICNTFEETYQYLCDEIDF